MANNEAGRAWYRNNWKWQRCNANDLAGYGKMKVRVDMRWAAWMYADLRGWKVALTPPQRQKGIR